jgi:hypothetical protein
MSSLTEETRKAETGQPAGPRACPNCGETVALRFCPRCGQENHDVIVPVRDLLGDVMDEFLKLDSRVFDTLKRLLFRPGALTLEYIAGRRAAYVPPFKLYFLISALFFLMLSYTSDYRSFLKEAEGSGTPVARSTTAPRPTISAEERKYEVAALKLAEWLITNQGMVAFAMVPVFALLLKLVHRRRKRLYIEHLVFAVHLHAFVFLLWTLLLPRFWGVLADPLTLCIPTIYLFIAMRRVYGDGTLGTLWKMAVVGVGYVGVLLTIVMVAMAFFVTRVGA